MAEPVITVNPTTGAELQRYPAMSPAEIDAALAATHKAQPIWAARGVESRVEVLRSAAELLRVHKRELALQAVREMGKPVGEALGEVEKCAWVCDHYARHAPEMLASEEQTAAGSRSWIQYEPLGVVLAVMPWNFPFWQVLRFAAPALASGNAALLKHAPNVTGCALAVQHLLGQAGLPDGAFTTLVVAEPEVPDTVSRLIADDRVAAVTLTGSNRAGAHVAAAAGRTVKKSVLELGGSDPFVVLADADLDTVVPRAVAARFLNSGQSCLAAKRFLVHHSRLEEFTTRLAAAVRELTVGDPAEDTTQIGPLARADLADAVENQVKASVDAGASIVTGGTRLEAGAAWFAPTVLADVTDTMPVMREETFGPVAAVMGFSDHDEAVRLANHTPYGLGASVWSAQTERALAVGRRIQSGALFINAVVASDPRLPFGGVKQSGYGRELGQAGLREFTNTRTVVIGLSPDTPDWPY